MSRTGPAGMAGLARAALEEHRIRCAGLRLVSLGTNTCYRVETPDGELLFLRIVSPESRHGRAELEASMGWQEAVASEVEGVTIPGVLRTPSGEAACEVRAGGCSRVCTLERWVPGRRPGRRPSIRLSRDLGLAAAAFHDFSASYRIPDCSAPRVYDAVLPYREEGGHPGEPVMLFTPGGRNGLDRSRCRIFARAHEAVQEAIDSLYGRGCPPPVMIHCDLHPWNTKTGGRRTAILDFEDSMLGHPVQDIATSLYYFRHGPSWGEHLGSFRKGYESLRAWPFGDGQMLETLMAGRILLLANFVLGLEGERWSGVGKGYVETALGRLEEFLDRPAERRM